MITLTRITEPAKLQEYFQFRYRIYNESRLKSFVDTADGTDMDGFDVGAHHFGWYVDGKLAGCIRFVEPDGSAAPIPMLYYMTDSEAVSAVRSYITERKANGQRMIEASRFCLAPEYRGMRTAREFVMAMVRKLHELTIDHGSFDCFRMHAPFYKRLGFDMLPDADNIQTPAGYRGCTISYAYDQIIANDPGLVDLIGTRVGQRHRNAA